MSDKKYNKSVASMWRTKTGNYMSMTIDQYTYDQIQQFAKDVQVGGKLIVKNLADESRAKFKGGLEKAPHAFLEYITKESADEFSANNPRQRQDSI